MCRDKMRAQKKRLKFRKIRYLNSVFALSASRACARLSFFK